MTTRVDLANEQESEKQHVDGKRLYCSQVAHLADTNLSV